MITTINESKTSTYHKNVKVNLMTESINWIKTGVTINVNVIAKIKINKKRKCVWEKYIWNASPSTCKNSK